jgi:arabinose-5-phosphate isomerase
MFMTYLDALLTVLIELKNFNAESLKNFHPGGKLGVQLLRVSDLMHTQDTIPLINFRESSKKALEEINTKGLGTIGVLDDNRQLVGVITDGDIRRKTIEYGNILQIPLIQLMTPSPRCIEADKLAIEAVVRMTENGRYMQVLFVVNSIREVIGILHIYDLLRAKVI